MSQFDPRPISKVAKSERTKLLANSVNTVGLTVLGLGLITPSVTGGRIASGGLTFPGAIAICILALFIARRLLKGLED